MTRDIHSTKSFLTTRFLWVMLAVALFCSFPATQPFAQDKSILTLTDWNSYDLANHFYVTPDPDKHLSPDTLINRYKSNLRGTKIYSDVIKVNNAQEPIWIIFTVYNKSPVQDWILDFGSSVSGRMGMIKTINIINYSTKQVFNFPNDASKKAKGTDIGSDPFVGSALALDIMPGTQNTFIMRIEAQQGFPLVFHPKLVPQHNYMHQLMRGDISHVIAAVLFIGIGTFFIAAFYIRRNKSSLAMASYYMILCALFFNFSSSVIPHFLISGPVLFGLYMCGYLLLIIATRFYCDMRYDDRPFENIALIVLGSLIILGTVTYLVVMGTSVTGLFIMGGLISICMMLLLAILFFSNEKPLVNTLLFSAGPVLSALAFVYLTLINADIITASSLSVSIFWYFHVLQGGFLIAAYFHTGMILNHKDILEEKERYRDEQSLARLQKSKESADQARLIRVIERERELMAELREREVKRTEEMRIAKDSADRANQAKSAFLAVVSHEIRTPMNGILGMVQLLQKTTLSKTQHDYVETIKKSGDTMMALLNDILDFEKIERGSMSLEILNFDLHRLVNDVAILMSGHASQKNISLNAEIDESNVPSVVSGDPTRLRQILLNLVNNAIKFTEKGGVTIHVARQRGEGPDAKDKIRIAIKDTGIGISEEGQKKLFTPFTQAESSTARKYGGTGLGLAISYRLVEAMGGSINVQSVEGQGSTFFFDLDMIVQDEDGKDKVVDDEHFAEENNNHSARSMNILVTEDNEMNRKVLEGLLSQQGHTLFMAASGMEALEICHRQELDLILMDIQMDGLNGLETTKKLRMDDNKEIANIPVIALTGNVMFEDIQTFFEVGMNGFIAKPIDSKKLDEVIYNASIGKFENDPKRSDEEQETTREPEVSSSAPGASSENSAIDLSDIDTGLSFDDREHFISDSQIPSSLSKPTDSPLDTANTSGFSFDDENDNNIDIDTNADAAAEAVQDNEDNAEEENGDNDEDGDEITEVQRFLIEQGSYAPIKPSKTKVEQEIPPVEIIETPSVEVPAQTPEDSIDAARESVETSIDVARSSVETSLEAISNTQEEIPPAPEKALPENNEPDPSAYNVEEFLDLDMLKQLIGTLGKDQFFSLLEGFQNKANEIVDVIESLHDGKNLATLGGRAHELKGLAGNFGMYKLSELAGEIEKSARLGQKDNAVSLSAGLHELNTQTQDVLSYWAKQQA